jgi:2-dehydropantoate 2-reductase
VKVQVFGAGSLGTLIGALLYRGGTDVHLVGRERVVDAFEDGISVTGTEEFVAHPTFSTVPREADVTVVTVKSYDTPAAAEELRNKGDTVVSLQNGMGNEEVLDDRLDATVLGGTATYGANLRVEDGVLEYAGKGRVVLGDYCGGASDKAERIAESLDGIDIRATEEMDEVLWEKLAVNAAINPVTALTNTRNGEAAERAGGVMKRAAREVEEVAAENGVGIDGTGEHALKIARDTSENVSSTLQDIRAGRKTEIDSLNGYVVKKAQETDVRTNETLFSLVRSVGRTK